MHTETQSPPYLAFTLALSVFALAILGAGIAVPMSRDTHVILDYADDALCAIFFVDFIVTLRRAENRWKYFATWGWIDLLSCIPSIDYLRAGRLVRVVRVFRVLRAMRSAKVIASFILKRRAQSAMLAATLMGLLLVVLAAIGILYFEDVPDANIRTAEDALWWTMTTITTVGYGDRYPVTTEGRVLAAGLMIAGVGLAGIYTGYVASWFMRPAEPTALDQDERITTLASSLVGMSESDRAALSIRIDQMKALLKP